MSLCDLAALNLRLSLMKREKQGTPPAKEPQHANVLGAIVQCQGYRCWAKKDQNSEWIDWQGKKLNVIEVVTIFR